MESEKVAEPVNKTKDLKKHSRPQYLLPGSGESNSCCICQCLCPYSKYKDAVQNEWDSADECSKKCCAGCKSCYTNPCCYLCCCYYQQPCECIFPRCILCPCCYCAICQTCPRCIACGWCLWEMKAACREEPLVGAIMFPCIMYDLCYECCYCSCCDKNESSKEDSNNNQKKQLDKPNQQQDPGQPNQNNEQDQPNQAQEPAQENEAQQINQNQENDQNQSSARNIFPSKHLRVENANQ